MYIDYHQIVEQRYLILRQRELQQPNHLLKLVQKQILVLVLERVYLRNSSE